VSGFTVNDGSPQQSMVKSLTYTFNNPTEVEPGAFELLRNGKPSNINLVVTPLADRMTYLITFSGPGLIGGSVPDGSYTLITLHNKVKVLSGPPMTANDVNTFVRLFGDVNGDGVVNALDKAYLKEAEANPASPYAADFEYDGKPVIDKTDIAQFDKRYKGSMDPPKKAPAKFPGRTVYRHLAALPLSTKF
jgi:Dockerin type I domain